MFPLEVIWDEKLPALAVMLLTNKSPLALTSPTTVKVFPLPVTLALPPATILSVANILPKFEPLATILPSTVISSVMSAVVPPAPKLTPLSKKTTCCPPPFLFILVTAEPIWILKSPPSS